MTENGGDQGEADQPTDLPGGDFATLKASVKNKLYVLDDDTIVYPGHMGRTTVGREKQSNPFVRA